MSDHINSGTSGHQFPTCVADEMREMLGQANTMLNRLRTLPACSERSRVQGMLEGYIAQINNVGIQNIRFFDTVDYYEQLERIRGHYDQHPLWRINPQGR